MLGLAYQAIVRRRYGGLPEWPLFLVLGLFVAAFAVDGINSYLTLFLGGPLLYQPQNWLRLVTGTGMGLMIAAVLFPAFNQTVWREYRKEPALDLRSLVVLLILALGLDLVVLSENPLILYPVIVALG